jgi:hypothetical protein
MFSARISRSRARPGIFTATLFTLAAVWSPAFAQSNLTPQPGLGLSPVWTATVHSPDSPHSTITPIPDLENAEAFARQIVEQKQPVVLFHVGDHLPAQLTWILAILDQHQIPYTAKLVTPQELAEVVDQEIAGARVVLQKRSAFLSDGRQPSSIHWIQKIFGFPSGATLWFRFDKGLLPNFSDGARAFGDGVATAISVYAGKAMGMIHGDIAAPLVAITGWAMLNSGFARYLNRMMSAGRSIEVVGRTLKSRDNYLYSLTLGTFRAFLTNLVVFFSFYQSGWIDNPELLQDFVRSGFATPLARVAVDMYLRDRQPGLIGDGGSQERAQMNRWLWSALFVTWNILAGSLRAGDALGHNGAMYIHGAFATAGFLFVVSRTFFSMRAFRCEWALQGNAPVSRR